MTDYPKDNDVDNPQKVFAQLKWLSKELEETQRLAGVGTFRYNLDGDFFALSRECARIMGKKKRLVQTRGAFLEALDDDSRIQLEALINTRKAKQLSIKLKGKTHSDDPNLKTGKSWRWVSLRAECELASDNETVIGIFGTISDIHDQEKVKQELEMLSLVAERMQSMVTITHPDGRIIWVNEAFRRQTGYHLNEVKGQISKDFLYGEKTDSNTAAIIDQRVKAGKPYTVELVEYHRSGRPFWVVIDAMPILSELGKIDRYITIESNVTEQVEARERLRDSESRYRDVVKASGEFVWEVNGKIHYTYLSERVLEVTGYTVSEMLGRKLYEFVPEKSIAALKAAFSVSEESGFTPFRGLEFPFLRKDGKQIWLRMNGVPLRVDGKYEGFRGTCLEITDSRETAEALRLMNLRYQTATEASNIGIWEYDVLTERLVWDANMFRIFNISEEGFQFSLNDWRKRVVEKDRIQAETLFMECIEKGISFVSEFRILLDNGEYRYIHGFGKPVIEENETIKMVGTNIDITESRTTHEALKQAKEDAENANHAKSAFLAMMSHEIRTPMNGVVGMTSILEATELTEEQGEYVATIKRSGIALVQILNDILDYSKIESGRMDFDYQPTELISMVESAVEIHAPNAQEKDLEIVVNFNGVCPEKADLDELRIRQILGNLLGNAVKFGGTGYIVVNVECVKKHYKNYLQIEVEDSGVGIAEEHAELIFEAFSQADRSTTRRYGGTGLGLAICKKLVELMDGEIWYRPNVGKGSVFGFRIPSVFGNLTIEGAIRRQLDLTGKRIQIFASQTNSAKALKSFVELTGAVSYISRIDETIDSKADLVFVDFDGSLIEQAARFSETDKNIIMLVHPGRHISNHSHLGRITKPWKVETLLRTLKSATTGKESSGKRTVSERILTPRKLRILLAEDNLTNQKVALIMLKQLGYAADCTSNGQEALEMCMKSEYDIILMDLQMPVMDGLDATAAIRASGKSVIIIALTAAVLEEDQKKAYSAGVDGFLTKPVRRRELLRVLNYYEATLKTQTSE